MISKKQKIRYLIYGIFVMLTMYVFYTSFKPIMVCDPDDWTYIGYIRKPVPIWKDWNPAKILPETTEGLLGYFAAYVIYPICGDYIMSFTYVFAGFISICIATYVVSSALLLKKIIPDIKDSVCIIASYLLFLVNFIMLRGNNFFFTASNLNCFINYLFPTIFCLVLINYLVAYIQCDKIIFVNDDKAGYLKVGILILAIYLAVFSNMVCNVIFVIPMGLIYLDIFFRKLKTHKMKELIRSFKDYWVFYYTFVLELICLFYEYNGGRANSFSLTLNDALNQSIEDFKYICHITDKKILALCVVIIICCLISNKNHDNRSVQSVMKWYIIGFIIITIYLFALYTKIGNHKIQRCENIFVMYILFVEASFIAFGYLLDKYSKVMVAIPLMVLVMTAMVAYGDYKPSMSYYYGDRYLCYIINNNIIEQFIAAERTENYEFELHIPRSGLGGYDFSGDRIAATLYKHGITASKLKPHLILEEYSWFIDR